MILKALPGQLAEGLAQEVRLWKGNTRLSPRERAESLDGLQDALAACDRGREELEKVLARITGAGHPGKPPPFSFLQTRPVRSPRSLGSRCR